MFNAGRRYPPGGFIDRGDVDPAGRARMDASIARQIGEELGLSVGALERQPGFWLTQDGIHISIAAQYRAAVTSSELTRALPIQLDSQGRPELADIVLVKSMTDLDGKHVPGFATRRLEQVFAQHRPTSG